MTDNRNKDQNNQQQNRNQNQDRNQNQTSNPHKNQDEQGKFRQDRSTTSDRIDQNETEDQK